MKKRAPANIENYIKAVQGMKALDIVVLDLRNLTSFTDAFIICSGRSHRQVVAIADFVAKTLKASGIRAYGIEGLKEGHWVLMDYGDVIIHIFHEPVRQFYDLEGLWIDAKRIEVPDVVKNDVA